MQILEPALKVGQQLQMCFHLHDFDICIAVLCFRQVSLYVHRRTSGLFRWLKLYAFQSKLIKCQHITPVSNWNHTGLLLILLCTQRFNLCISVPYKKNFQHQSHQQYSVTLYLSDTFSQNNHGDHIYDTCRRTWWITVCVSTGRTNTRFLPSMECLPLFTVAVFGFVDCPTLIVETAVCYVLHILLYIYYTRYMSGFGSRLFMKSSKV